MCVLLLLLSVHGGGMVCAQDVPKPEVSVEEAAEAAVAAAKEQAELEKIQEEALAEILAGTTELSPEQQGNFEKWIPHTIKRLQKRLPVHIAVLGDSVTRFVSYDENVEDSHFAYHGVFAKKLADEFFYTGGVRDIRPTQGREGKPDPLFGPELTLENLGMSGRVSLHALSRITADGLVNQPDLVLINFGINDALLNVGIATYVEAIETSVKYVKSTGADVILLGPTSTLRIGTAEEMALTRPYAGAMEEVANRLGVFYFDLGSVTQAGPGMQGGQSAEQVMGMIEENCRRSFYDHGAEIQDGLHPTAGGHKELGMAIFNALRDGVVAEPYRIKGFVELGGAGKAVFEFKVKNMQDSAGKGLMFFMPVAGMKPEVVSQAFELGAGKAQEFRVNYVAVDGYDFPADAPRVFAPLLISDARRTYGSVLAVPLTPMGLVWDTGVQDLGAASFEVACEVVATGAAAVSGAFEAVWNGQVSRGNFTVPASGKSKLPLKFEVPSKGDHFTVRDDLVLTLKVGTKEFRFVRTMEASRNLGLGESVAMLNPSKYVKGEAAVDGRVLFMATATAQQLVLNFDVENIPLEGDEKNTALFLEFQLDARGYGKRRAFGFVDSVRLKLDQTGVPERLSDLRPAVFGDWYNRTLDSAELKTNRQVLENGRVRYSIAVPRSYLYLHEYALGNGNSMFGINASLQFARRGAAGFSYPAELSYVLVESGLSVNVAESLTVLELTERATGRWSVRLR